MQRAGEVEQAIALEHLEPAQHARCDTGFC